MTQGQEAYRMVYAHLMAMMVAADALKLPKDANPRAVVADASHMAKAHSLEELWNAPQDWPAEMVVVLGALAAMPGEHMRLRNNAIGLIGRCGFRQFAGQLAAMLAEYGKHPYAADSIACALGNLQVRNHLPVLADVAREAANLVKVYPFKFLQRECVNAIYRIIFDDQGRGPGTLARDAMTWWQAAQPTPEQIDQWSRSQNIPPEDGFSHPSRSV